MWNIGNYYQSGVSAGKLDGIFLNNVPTDALEDDFKDKYTPAQFFAGWYYGRTTHDKRDKILDCYEPSRELSTLLNEGMQGMIDGLPKEQAEKKMNKATRLMAKALKSCHRLDYHMFEKQADILDEVSDRLDIDEEFMKHVFSEYGDELMRDAQLWMREWKQGVPFNSGMFFGQFEKIFVDANEEYPLALEGSQRDSTAPAQFTAGWYYGVSTEDKRDQILECFAESDDLTNALYDAMEAYIAGDQ